MKTAILIVVASVHFTGSYFNQSELSSVLSQFEGTLVFPQEETGRQDCIWIWIYNFPGNGSSYSFACHWIWIYNFPGNGSSYSFACHWIWIYNFPGNGGSYSFACHWIWIYNFPENCSFYSPACL